MYTASSCIQGLRIITANLRAIILIKLICILVRGYLESGSNTKQIQIQIQMQIKVVFFFVKRVLLFLMFHVLSLNWYVTRKLKKSLLCSGKKKLFFHVFSFNFVQYLQLISLSSSLLFSSLN